MRIIIQSGPNDSNIATQTPWVVNCRLENQTFE